MEQLGQLIDADAAAPGLSAAAIHVAVARSGPDEWNALITWFDPPVESANDDSVSTHQTPAFAA